MAARIAIGIATNRLLTIAAALEAALGIALIASPALVTQLLLSESVSGISVVISRVAGIALLALGIAGLPDRGESRMQGRAHAGLLAYNGLASFYLLYLGLRGEWVGQLLWSAVVLHTIMTLLLAYAWLVGSMRTSASTA
jgi:hypothetical protein